MINIRKTGFILFALFLFGMVFGLKPIAAETSFNAEDLQARFDQANRLYDQQKFEKARGVYEEISKGGINDPVILYNLGNACARTGDVGAAALYYTRALRLAPRDRDIRENLSRLEPAINRSNTFFLLEPFAWLKNLLSLDAWTILCSMFLSLACLSLGFYFLTQRENILPHLKKGFISFLILFLITGSMLAFKIYGEVIIKSAIVMKADALARSGPGDQFEELYKLPAGTGVRIISKPQNSWVRTRLMDGRSAYLPLTEIQGVN
jgi:tetratricopeptide (TPR) repeat protein